MATTTRSHTGGRSLPPLPSLYAVGWCCITVLLVVAVSRLPSGAPVALATAVVLVGVSAATATRPHIVFAALIPLFILIPAIRTLWVPQIGAAKDLLIAAVLLGATVQVIARAARGARISTDAAPVLMALALACLYVMNVAGSHGAGWFHGSRLVIEPLVLFVTGLLVTDPRRTFRWAVVSFLASAAFLAAFGCLQQILGPFRLADLGFQWNTEIRIISGQLRSFGTVGDPFNYASILVVALTCAAFVPQRIVAFRPGVRTALLVTLAAGLAASLVRTAAVSVVMLVALALLRRGHGRFAVLTTVGALATGVLALGLVPHAVQSQQYVDAGGSFTLNGRTELWASVVPDVRKLPFGQGVGVVGTGAERAQEGLVQTRQSVTAQARGGTAVDSMYLATLSDTGLLGVAVLVSLLATCAVRGWRGIRRGLDMGWLVLGVAVVTALDGVTRASLGAFPSSFIAWPILGLAVATLAVEAARPLPRHGAVVLPGRTPVLRDAGTR